MRPYLGWLLLAAALPASAQRPVSTPASGDEERVVAFHAARVKARPDDAGALRFLAGALIKLAELTGEPREYDRAWEALERAETLEPGDPGVLSARARLLLSRHRFPQAFALAEAGLKRNPQDPDLLGMAGDAALELGDWDIAEARFRRQHDYSPQLNTWARLAYVAELRGRLDEAGSLLEKALETGVRKGAPAESVAWCRAVLGEVHLKRGDAAEARRQYGLGLEKQADHPLVLEHLGELEKKEERLAEAEAVYRKLLARRQADPVNRLRLADIVEARGDQKGAAALRDEARRFLERVVAAGNEGYLRPLAELDFAAGRFPRAASLAARDVALRPTPDSRALLSKILEAAAAAGKPVNGFAP